MKYYEVVFTQTTTNGDELVTISTGEGTGDVETIITTEDAARNLTKQMDNFIEQQVY